MNPEFNMQGLYAYNRQQIQSLLGWDDLTYCEVQYRMGLRYLNEVLMPGPGTKAYLERSALYWQWWIGEWNRHDHHIVIPALRHGFTEPVRDYIYSHSPEFLLLHPSYPAMEESYAYMLGNIYNQKSYYPYE